MTEKKVKQKLKRNRKIKEPINETLFRRIIVMIVFLLGLGIFLYPIISNYFMVRSQTMVIQTYEEKIKKIPKKEKEVLREKIKAYNEKQSGHKIQEDVTDVEKKSSVQSGEVITSGNALDEAGNEIFDVMKAMLGDEIATVDIPKIHVTVPVYQGTTEDILQKGVGLLEGSAIPLGGKGSHAVITGHSGLPSAKIFTDLPKLKKGDVFFIQSFDEKLAYEVDQKLTVEPHEVEALKAEPDKDYATLITCVPYAVNTHRLFVRGHRITYKEKQKKAEDRVAQKEFKAERLKWYLVFAGGILLFIFITIWMRKQSKLRLNR